MCVVFGTGKKSRLCTREGICLLICLYNCRLFRSHFEKQKEEEIND